MLRNVIAGICAGIMICIGGAVFLACDINYIGAVLFAVALLCICLKGYSLFTGKVGYLAVRHDKDAVEDLLLGLLGNFIATVLGGMLLAYANPAIAVKASAICEAKLLQAVPQTLIRSVFCGILMYLAVSTYKEKNTLAGIFFCVPVFILAGFEHSIANMFYFSAAGMLNAGTLVYLVIVILGNSIGGLLMPVLETILKKEK